MAARAVIWQAVSDLIAKRPWFGYGFDNLEIVFPAVYPPQLVYYQGRDVMVDRAHQLILDTLVTTGIAGFVTKFLLVWTAVVPGMRNALTTSPHTRDWSPIVAAASAALVANFTSNLTGFDVTATATASWLLLGLLAAASLAETPSYMPVRTTAYAAPVRLVPVWVTATLVLVAVAVSVQFNVCPLVADVAHRSAAVAVRAGQFEPALAAAENAVRVWPLVEHHWLVGEVWLYAARIGAAPPDQALAKAEYAYFAPLAWRSSDAAVWAALGDFYRFAGLHFNPDYLQGARFAYARAQVLAPHHATLHVAMAEVFLAQGDSTNALAQARRAVDLDATHGTAYRLIGDILYAQGGDPAEALEAYTLALHWSPADTDAHNGLALVYEQLGDPDAAARIRRAAQQLAPPSLPGFSPVQPGFGKEP